MYDRRRIKCCILLVLAIMGCIHIHLGYFCGEKDCALSSEGSNADQGDGYPKRPSFRARSPLRVHTPVGQQPSFHVLDPLPYPRVHPCPLASQPDPSDDLLPRALLQNFSSVNLPDDFRLDIDGPSDVLVFLHIQKTGGTTFGRHLVTDLRMTRPCLCHQGRKKCECRNSRELVWLVSRYSTGWRCGLHADWTELTSCVNRMLNKAEGKDRERRYLYVTILRDPLTRYMSEFKHVQRGATWKAARLQCNGRQASLEEVPFCFDGDDWTGVSLDEFLECPHNLANNRQTRMLANLSLTGCYKRDIMPRDHRDCAMLHSAKQNLRNMAFFGLTEYQRETQYMFERTFGLDFAENFFQYNHTHAEETGPTRSQLRRILATNHLDTELYNFAKELFFQRLRKLQERDFRLRTSVSNGGGTRVSRDNRGSDYHYSVSIGDYDEEDENFADDDDAYNRRIAERSRKYTRHKLSTSNRRQLYRRRDAGHP